MASVWPPPPDGSTKSVRRTQQTLLISCAWALGAFGLRQIQLSQSTSVAVVALVCAGILVLAMLFHGIARGLSYDGPHRGAPA